MNKLLKAFTIICILAASTPNVDAAIYFYSYGSFDGFYRNDDSTELLSPAPQTAFIQLIFSTVNAYTDPTAVVGGGVSANETVFDTYVITTEANPSYGSFGRTDPARNTNASPGFVYVRIFDQGTSQESDVVVGTYYYDSPIYTAVDNSSITPTLFNGTDISVNGASPSGAFAGADFLYKQVTIVPEPAAAIMFGFGLVTLAVRRRFMT